MITDKIEYEYSLDDQCRMEFDRGFSFCRSFQLADPCEHLWCAHRDTPLLCKTKKGPPMDGTACGPDKVCRKWVVYLMVMMVMLQWCVNGRCESTSKNIGRTDSLQHNSEAGGWSSWSRWGQCSRTCGAGAAFRTRRCNNPRPSYGGAPCRGNSEQFRLCNIFRSVNSPHHAPLTGQHWQNVNSLFLCPIFPSSSPPPL